MVLQKCRGRGKHVCILVVNLPSGVCGYTGYVSMLYFVGHATDAKGVLPVAEVGVSHVGPDHQVAHLQEKVSPEGLQVPLFLQGLGLQGSVNGNKTRVRQGGMWI